MSRHDIASGLIAMVIVELIFNLGRHYVPFIPESRAALLIGYGFLFVMALPAVIIAMTLLGRVGLKKRLVE